jgi:hypothetical protein
MPPDDIEIEEYKSLRTSIDMHMKLIPEIFAIMVAATSALLGYGIGSKSAGVFLLPLLIIIPCAFLILAQMNEVMLKGAYIKKRYEQDFKGWESTLFECRKIREKGKKGRFAKAAKDAQAFVLIIDFLILICLAGFIGISDFLLIIRTISECSYSSAWGLVVFSIVLWVSIAGLTISLNKKMLKAYTSEKEGKNLEKLDKVFNNNGESMSKGE